MTMIFVLSLFWCTGAGVGALFASGGAVASGLAPAAGTAPVEGTGSAEGGGAAAAGVFPRSISAYFAQWHLVDIGNRHHL